MATTYHTDRPEVRQMALAAFPGYTGRKFSVTAFRGPKNLASYWDGGSRDTFALVRMDDLKAVDIPENGTPYSRAPLQLDALPPGTALVEHSIFHGKDFGLTLHVPAENLAPLLPAGPEATWEQRVVLAATAGYKNSYGGETGLRRRHALEETEIPGPDYDRAHAECIAKRWLNKSGALTDEGRNVIQDTRLRQLCEEKHGLPVPPHSPYRRLYDRPALAA